MAAPRRARGPRLRSGHGPPAGQRPRRRDLRGRLAADAHRHASRAAGAAHAQGPPARRAALRLRSLCAAQRGAPARRRGGRGAGPGVRRHARGRGPGRARTSGRRALRAHESVRARARALAVCPIAPGCRGSSATRTCAGPTAAKVWPAWPKRHAAASTRAGIVRSSPCTRGASWPCRPTSCSTTSARRSPRARHTSRSPIPTSSTAPPTRCGSWRRCTTRGPRSPTTPPSRSSTCAGTTRCCRGSWARAARSSRRPSSRSTTPCWRASTRATRAPTSRQ